MGSEKEFQCGHYSDLPQSEFEHDDLGEWSNQYSGWWHVSDVFGSERLSVTILEKPPGQEGKMHAHEPPVEEYYVVLKGKIDIVLPDRTIEGATPGTIAYFPPGLEHKTVNSYDEPVVQLGFRSLDGRIDALHDNIRSAEEP